MDYARSCYKRRMRFVKDDLNTFADVTWFFAASTAKPFPTWHRFGSANWDNERGEFSDLGDDAQRPQKWSNGRRMNRSDGTSFAGPLDFFQQGADAPGDLPRACGCTPVECLSPPFGLCKGGNDRPVTLAKGGLRKGGIEFSPTVPFTCAGVPSTIFAVVTAGTGVFVPFIGHLFTMPFSGGHWLDSATIGGHTLQMIGNCSFDVMINTGTYDGFTVLGSGSPTTLPLDYNGNLFYGADTATVHYYQ